MISAGRLTALTFLAACSLLPVGSTMAQQATAQPPDVAQLVHPDVAQRLSLDDAQRAKIQQLLLARSQALAESLAASPSDDPAAVAAAAEQRKAAAEKTRQEILAVLTPEQLAQWSAHQPEQKLMFQFREMKWQDVLSWFAAQQDLTLVMDRVPAGTFTYSDTRAYSPSEGIDLLNSVLMTRGFTLVRREKMLVVMELNDSIPLELLPRVPLEQLDERGRFEIVSVLFPLSGRPVDAVLQEVKPYLSSYGRAIPLARGGQLLVVETAGKMRTINELIASVPVPKQAPKPDKPPEPPKPVFAAYTLGELDGATVLETVTKLIPSDQITVDGRSGVLSAFVIPDQQTAIKSAIDQMQASRAALPEAQSVAYRVTGIKPEDLQSQLASLAPRATITVGANRVLVTADADDQEVIRQALAALQIEPVAAERDLQVFEVSKSSAEQVGTALRTFLPNSFVVSNTQTGSVLVRGSQTDLQLASNIVDIWRQTQQSAGSQLKSLELDRPASAAWLATVQNIVPDTKVWLSELQPGVPQQLMLLGTEQDIARIEDLLPQLLSSLPAPDRRQLQIYPLSDNQAARQSSLATLPGELADVRQVLGQGGRELLVWATPAQHATFAELLEQLDQPVPKTTLIPRSYALKVQSPTTVTQLLTAEFPSANLTVNTKGDELTVLASAEQHEQIAQRVAEFNQELPSKAELTVETYSVDGMTAVALQQALLPLLATAQTTVDSQSERLLIRTDADTHAQLREVADALGAQPETDRQKVVIAYPLAQAAASNVKLLLDQIVRDATVLADDKLRQVIVTGSLHTHSQVKAAIDQIDGAGGAPQTTQIRSYDAGQLTASALLGTLQAMWPNMQLSADSATNQVVAVGTQRDQQELEAALLQLTSAPGGEAQLAKTYPVPFGEMSTLTTVLRQIAPRALLSVDSASRTVTVWAIESQQKKVEQALKTLSEAASESQHPATYMVKPSQVYAVQASLRTLFPSAVSSFDPTSGQMVVVASQPVQERIAGVIEMLAKGAGSDEKTTKVFEFDPKRAQLSSILVALQSMIPAQVRLEANPANNTLLAIGSPEDLLRVSQQIEQLTEQLPAPDELKPVVYSLKYANPLVAVPVLSRLLPTVTFAPDAASKTISATAKADEHQTIQEFLLGFDQPIVNDKETRVYKLQRGSGRGLSYVLSSLMPDATFYGSYDTGGLVATALPEQHERIEAIVKEFDVDRENTQTRVFAIGKGSANSMQSVIRDIASEASVTVDSSSNSLIVTASVEDLGRIGQLLDQIEKEAGGPQETRFYSVTGSEPQALTRALVGSFPKATFAPDSASGGLFATATPQEHIELAKVIDELNQQPTLLPTLKAFKIEHASPEMVATAIQDALGRRTRAGVSFNREARSVFVVGSRDDLQVAQALIEQIDVPSSGEDSRKLRVFSLGGADGRSLTSAIENLFQESSARIDVRYDSFNEQLFVVGDPGQLKLVEEMLEQLTPPDRQLQIIQLEATDPYSFKLAADALFEDEPMNSTPSITIDGDQQRVIIRATAPQMGELKQLLQQMGEAADDVVPANHARLRIIPIPRDSDKLLAEMRRLWPAAGSNAIQVVRPSAASQSSPNASPPDPFAAPVAPVTPVAPLSPAPPPAPPPAAPPAAGDAEAPRAQRPPAAAPQPQSIPQPQSQSQDASSSTQSEDTVEDPSEQKSQSSGQLEDSSDNPQSTRPKLTSAPKPPTAADSAVESEAESEAESAVASADGTSVENADDTSAESMMQDGQGDQPPIVVVVGDEQWTVASADTQALDRFQRLLDTLLSPRAEPFVTTGNYSVYLLRHAGADVVQDLLDDLFRPERGRNSSSRDLMQRVKVVADSRINALIVSGNRQDRRMVEELLGVLDSEELLDSLQQISPTTLPLESATATSVERILRDVYRAQLSSSAGRRPVPIPEGVSSDVSLMLQQINAQTSGPLLTLAVDETSNSIIFRAPIELAAEVRTFVENLDRTSQETPSKRVDVIRLQSTNVRSLQQALKILLAK